MKPNIDKIVFLDFETFYSSEFSLTKKAYNTSSYVRDAQFMVHCVAIKIGTGDTVCYSAAEGEAVLRAIDWTEYALCAHNAAFDGLIMSHLYGIIPHYYYDTVSQTRGLHNDVSRANLATIAEFYGIGEKSKTYLTPTLGLRELPEDVMIGLMDGCSLDVDLCYKVFEKQVAIYPEHELDLIDLTMRMFCDPVLVIDEPMASIALAEEMMARKASILKSGAEEEDLMSNPKFAKLLVAAGITPPTKISNKTGLENFAFAQSDPEFTDLLDHENLQVVLLAQGRLAAKSTQAETRAHRLIEAGANGWRLPVGYNYFGAKTGRWSGTNKLNLQNLPRVNPYEPKPSDGLRRCIRAPDNHSLVVTDSAQIEARIIAWLAGQTDVVDLFAANEDVYKHMAASIYKKPLEEITKDERFIGKIAVLGLGYGMGAVKFETTLAIGMMGPPVEIGPVEAARIVRLYRSKNKHIAQAWKTLNEVLEDMACGREGTVFNDLIEYDAMTVWLPNGMGLHYPGLHRGADGNLQYKTSNGWKKIYGGLLLENIVQALARIVVGEQMLLTQTALKQLDLAEDEIARVVLMTHDEIVSAIPTRYAEQFFYKQVDIMRQPPHNWGSDIPLDADGGYAENYSK
jgi:DNA polymerase